ncbi:MAG TPA: transcription termination/antitermination NusG family protein, partial [candidate division Zixibacteria bacterium]|nr:transcription termination/antitermination NusG family protein [candidate division Zixibacteria bacterium]
MKKEWYVLHTLTGQEAKARESIERRLDSEEMREYIDQVLIPTEKVAEVKKGVKTTTTRKFFPGYVLAHL